MCAATVLVLLLLAAGCTRPFYRRWADRDSYFAINERNGNPEWHLPRIDIDPAPLSRLADPYNPDRPPMPPDDPAADRYMVRANGMKGWKHWHDNGDAPSVEPPCWRDALSLDPDGVLMLTPDRAVALALLDSREYQSALEDVYLSALALTLNRFDFACHWFLTNDGTFEILRERPDRNRHLYERQHVRLHQELRGRRAAARGVRQRRGRQFHLRPHDGTIGPDRPVHAAAVRRAGRQVRMEGLTQGEPRCCMRSARSPISASRSGPT